MEISSEYITKQKEKRNDTDEERSLEFGDGQLYYETAGKECHCTVTCGILDSRMFDAVWEPLANISRDSIRYAGFGQSSPVTGPLCRRDDLDQLFKHLEVRSAFGWMFQWRTDQPRLGT
jgi:hypothetical protein